MTRHPDTLDEPLATPLLDTIHAAWITGWDQGYAAGVRAALDEHEARRLHARAAANALAYARIPNHHDLVGQRRTNTTRAAATHQARPAITWPDDAPTGRPAA